VRITFDEQESDIQREIKGTLETQGWLVEKIEMPARKGCSDLMCVKNGRVVLLEVKKAGQRPTRQQQIFRAEWCAHGGEAYWADSVEHALRHLA